MCYGCYEEYGAPKIVNDRTKEAASLAASVYSFAPVGGLCHIVLDDFNIEDSHIAFCIKEIAGGDGRYTPKQLETQRLCMEAFAAMSIEERASALAIFEGWIKP